MASRLLPSIPDRPGTASRTASRSASSIPILHLAKHPRPQASASPSIHLLVLVLVADIKRLEVLDVFSGTPLPLAELSSTSISPAGLFCEGRRPAPFPDSRGRTGLSPHRSLKHFIGNRQSAIGVIVSLISSPAFSPDLPARSPAIPSCRVFSPRCSFSQSPDLLFVHFAFHCARVRAGCGENLGTHHPLANCWSLLDLWMRVSRRTPTTPTSPTFPTSVSVLDHSPRSLPSFDRHPQERLLQPIISH